MASWRTCHFTWRFKFYYACLGFAIGISVLLSFGRMGNPVAGVWGMMSGIFAGLVALFEYYFVRYLPTADESGDARYQTVDRASGNQNRPEDDAADVQRQLVEGGNSSDGKQPGLRDNYDMFLIPDPSTEPVRPPPGGVSGSGSLTAANNNAAGMPGSAVVDVRTGAPSSSDAGPCGPHCRSCSELDIQRLWFSVGVLGVMSAAIAFVAYTVRSATADDRSLTVTSDWMSVVWTFMTFKWAFALAREVHCYNIQKDIPAVY